MRKSFVLAALFPHVRQGVLAATLTHPEKWWYLSELADRLGTTPSSLQRELSALVASGILTRRREGTRAYFKAETRSPVFRELQQLFEKTAGLVPIVKQIARIVPCGLEGRLEQEQRLVARGIISLPLKKRPVSVSWPEPPGDISDEVMEQVWRKEREDR